MSTSFHQYFQYSSCSSLSPHHLYFRVQHLQFRSPVSALLSLYFGYITLAHSLIIWGSWPLIPDYFHFSSFFPLDLFPSLSFTLLYCGVKDDLSIHNLLYYNPLSVFLHTTDKRYHFVIVLLVLFTQLDIVQFLPGCSKNVLFNHSFQLNSIPLYTLFYTHTHLYSPFIIP